jgi:hypothetical protein
MKNGKLTKSFSIYEYYIYLPPLARHVPSEDLNMAIPL